jgi:hypothetical protein
MTLLTAGSDTAPMIENVRIPGAPRKHVAVARVSITDNLSCKRCLKEAFDSAALYMSIENIRTEQSVDDIAFFPSPPILKRQFGYYKKH